MKWTRYLVSTRSTVKYLFAYWEPQRWRFLGRRWRKRLPLQKFEVHRWKARPRLLHHSPQIQGVPRNQQSERRCAHRRHAPQEKVQKVEGNRVIDQEVSFRREVLHCGGTFETHRSPAWRLLIEIDYFSASGGDGLFLQKHKVAASAKQKFYLNKVNEEPIFAGSGLHEVTQRLQNIFPRWMRLPHLRIHPRRGLNIALGKRVKFGGNSFVGGGGRCSMRDCGGSSQRDAIHAVPGSDCWWLQAAWEGQRDSAWHRQQGAHHWGNDEPEKYHPQRPHPPLFHTTTLPPNQRSRNPTPQNQGKRAPPKLRERVVVEGGNTLEFASDASKVGTDVLEGKWKLHLKGNTVRRFLIQWSYYPSIY